MENIIYIKLLEEGTTVYRPVAATELDKNVYRVNEGSSYDSEDEVWEFKPGAEVIVQEQKLGGKLVLVAVKEVGG